MSQLVVAQWKFTISVSKSGNCSGLDEIISIRAAEAIVKQFNGKTFSSEQDCENTRAVVSSVVSDGSCKVRLISSKCTGPGGATGGINVRGVSQGTSFYSTNSANEIQNWSEDYMERMLALNPEYKPKEVKTIATGDLAFDNLIENMPYSDEAFSGRMPRGSTNIEADDNVIAIGQPVRGNGVLVPDDFTSKPFDYGLGRATSDDLSFINIEIEPVKNSGINEEEGLLHKTLRSIDEKLDWYQAEDGNTFQYMYTRWGKENIMEVSDWWENNDMSNRISKAASDAAQMILSPIDKIREDAINTINENIDGGIGSTIRFLLPTQYEEIGERAQGIYDYGNGLITDVTEILPKAVNMISEGNSHDMNKLMNKVGINAVDGYIKLVNTTTGNKDINKSYDRARKISDMSGKPKEDRPKETAKWLVKEAKKEANKEAKKKVTDYIDPNKIYH